MTQPGRPVEPARQLSAATVTGLLASAELRPGDRVADRFVITRLLGMGGMGVVYQAQDSELGVDVALKILRPDLAHRDDAFDRFRQELVLARQVSSPHVVRIHDLVRHGQAWLISMDYVSGRSLEELLAEQGHLPPAQALQITRQLALGLQAAHQRQVVHRDLKPANVLIDEAGDALITDFGVARSAGRTGLTASGMIIGTPEYLSPEQARADPIDARSDLYALGLLLYEMLTGTLPFRGGTAAEMLAQRMVRTPPSPALSKPELPTFAVRLCMRLLELKPARRLQSAAAVVQAIEQEKLPGLPRQAMAPGWGVAVLAAGLIGSAGLAWWWYGPGTPVVPAAVAPAAVQQAAVDLLPLPFVVESPRDGDGALAAGIWNYLVLRHAGNSALLNDAVRAERGLSELGYDSRTARRYRARIGEALQARRLLEGTFTREGDKIQLRLARYLPGRDEPEWQTATPWVVEAELPQALTELATALHLALGESGPAGTWPSADVLAAVGAVADLRKPQRPPPLLAAAAAAGRDSTLWQIILRANDRLGQSAEAETAARDALDSLAGQNDLPALEAKGYAALLLADTATAIEQFRRALKLAPDDLPTQLLLARAEGSSGNLDEAQSRLQRVVAVDPRNADAWFGLGKFAIMQGQHKQAVDDYLVRALVLANRYEDDRLRADVTNALGLGYRHLGQLEPAQEQLERAVRLRAALGDTRGQAMSLRNLATTHAIRGQFDQADAALAQARQILAPLGDASALAGLTNDVGVLAEERGDYRKALAAYREALSFRQSLGVPREIAESLLNVGFAYYQIGEFDNAQVYWEQAATLYAGMDDPGGSVRTQQNLALAQIARGEFARARVALDASLSTAETQQMAEERAVSLASLAELDRLEGHYERALNRAAQADDLFRRAQDSRGVNEMQLLRGRALADLGDWEAASAVATALEGPAIAGSEQAAQLALLQAQIALGRDNPAAALTAAESATGHARDSHGLALEFSAYLYQAEALRQLRRTGEASAALKRARSLQEKYASVPLRLELALTALQVEPAQAGREYREALALLARLPSYGRALLLHARFALSTAPAADRTLARQRGLAAAAAYAAEIPAGSQAAFQAWCRQLRLSDAATP
ncbi:MAG: protein kinase [Rhodanobacteraceae bacterium]|nr:protein kinase [Rhodanobacteraceae bacterium]